MRKQYGVEVKTIAVDLTTPEAAQTVYDTCKEHGWDVDYLINNAGFGGQGTLPGNALWNRICP